MKHSLHNSSGSDVRIPARRMVDGLRYTVANNYGRVFATASAHWNRNFAGKEPSDACVRVRIATGTVLANSRFEAARKQYASLTA